MARLSLSFLGSFQVTLDGQPVRHFRVNVARALLVYLAVEADRPHQRETLAGLLWPDVANAVAINNLRHALSDLRKAIGDTETTPCLTITRHTLQFSLASDHWIDVHAFLSGLHAADPLRQGEAMALYRGPFLDGFGFNVSPAFEEWWLVRQQQYAQLAVDALQRLASWDIQRSAYRAAQHKARRLLELEPWHEDAHSLLIEALARDGRRAEALAQYDVYYRLMTQELGMPPSPNLIAQYERLRAGQTSATLASTPDSRLSPTRSASAATRPVFVAREAELIRLTTSLDSARGGSGQIVFITGEAGSGKTTLLDEFIRQAIQTHGDVLAASGTCSAYTGPGDPYLPVREITQLLTGDIEARRASGAITAEHARRLWDNLPDALQALVEHGSDLIGSFVNAEALVLRAEAFASTTTGWYARLAELVKHARNAPQALDVLTQFTAVLQALTQTRTLILVLDDLQWADEATLNWLFHVSRHLGGIRCLIIGAYRPADVALGRARQRHPLEAVLNELRRNLGDIQVDLDRSAGRAFIDALLDAEPNALPVEFRDTLFQHTGGNALFTVELISDLKTRGELVRDDQNRWVTGAGLKLAYLPVRVEAVIAERINRVPEPWQALLEAACVEGDEFTAEVVAEAIGLEAAAVTQALSGELNQRYQLITATRLERLGTQRLTHYRFRHNLFEKYLYQRLDAVRRVQLHEAIGTALEKRYVDRPADLKVFAPQLARQFEAAGLTLKAAEYWQLAGQRAARLAAYQEATVLLIHGLRLLDTLPDSTERAHGELNLQLALGAALLAQGWGTTDRARVFDRAFELALQTGATHDFLHTLFSLAQQAQGQGDIARALTFGLEMLRLAGKAGLRLQQAMAQQVVGANYCIAGRFATARDHLERALALEETESGEALLGQMGVELRLSCLVWLLVVHWSRGEADQAETHYQQVLQRAQQIDHPLSLAFALTLGICPWLLDQKELVKAQQHIATLRRLAETTMPLFQPWDKVFTGYARVCQGDRAGLAQLQQGIAAWDATGTRGGYVHQRLLLMHACLQAGEIEIGLQTAAEVVAQIEQHDWRMYEAEVRRVQGELWQAHGDQAQARACFQAAQAVARAQDARMWEERAAQCLQELSRAFQDRQSGAAPESTREV